MQGLQIEKLTVSLSEKEILKNISLTVKPGEVVALMGPNGSGKTTLAHTIMGREHYTITNGLITFNEENISSLSTHERAQKGLFLSFQQPVEIPGLIVRDYLREMRKSVGIEEDLVTFNKVLREVCERLAIPLSMTKRYLNQGFSGGEKKRMEVLQLCLLKTKLAILDETDSGLDIDAMRLVANTITAAKKQDMGILVITHYQRMLSYLSPDRVIVLIDGKIAKTGGPELVEQLEKEGYTPPSSSEVEA